MFKYILLVAFLIAVATAQNDTSVCTTADNRSNCFKCLSLNGACFFCTTLGCRPNTQTERTSCTTSEGSSTDQLSACPDPCYNPDNNGCTDCLSGSCGYCSSSGSCMTGTQSGPSYKSCGTWRFKNSTSPLTTTQTCSAYKSCSTINNCNTCVSTAQDASTPCNWCSATGGSTCVAGNTCPNGATLLSTCPSPDTSDASAVTAGVISMTLLAALAL